MASVQQKGDAYYCQFLFQGKRHTVTVGKVSRDEADTFAGKVDYLLMRIKQKLIRVPPGIAITDFVIRDGNITAAEVPVSPEPVLLKLLIEDYLAAHGVGSIEDSSLATVRMHLNHFLATLGERFPVQELTLADLQRHINRRATKKYRGQTLSPVTLQKEMASLRACWNWGVDGGKLTGRFPSRGLKYPKADEKPPFQTWQEIERKVAAGGLTETETADLWECLFLTQADTEELLDYVKANTAHDWIYPAIVFAAHTGARRSEVFRVGVHDLDFGAETVLIHEKKRAKGRRTTRRMPLSPFLVGVLKEWLAIHPGGQFLFCHNGEVFRSKKRSKLTGYQWGANRAKSLHGRKATVRTRSERPTQSAITRDEAHDHFQRTVAGGKWRVLRGWHVLRHSFISNCAAKGVDQRLIDAWVGHTTDEMRARYRHLIPSIEKQAIRSVFGG
jgi:integrase